MPCSVAWVPDRGEVQTGGSRTPCGSPGGSVISAGWGDAAGTQAVGKEAVLTWMPISHAQLLRGAALEAGPPGPWRSVGRSTYGTGTEPLTCSVSTRISTEATTRREGALRFEKICLAIRMQRFYPIDFFLGYSWPLAVHRYRSDIACMLIGGVKSHHPTGKCFLVSGFHHLEDKGHRVYASIVSRVRARSGTQGLPHEPQALYIPLSDPISFSDRRVFVSCALSVSD
jgi:hypothetical protein